ncbi:MAG: nitroreductase family protein [Candidatus Nanoarchaeia archaeon]|nr:nitroreductase family protein [Candidatus Nanoarchaeia archaeon]MDD5741763.1 nitroreductase family protein [Candidatus Nanoarchaeia archaeon]
MDFEKVIKSRASIRNYSDKKIDSDKVMNLIEAANLAPSPDNLSILKFIIVEDKEKISKIAQACQQPFVGTAPVLVIICSDMKNAEKMFDERAGKYIKQHAGAAIENFLLKITDMKLASCWIGAFSDITIKNILKIPDEIEVEAVLPIAYASKTAKTEQKPKHSLIDSCYFEEWNNKYKKPIKRVGEN